MGASLENGGGAGAIYPARKAARPGSDQTERRVSDSTARQISEPTATLTTIRVKSRSDSRSKSRRREPFPEARARGSAFTTRLAQGGTSTLAAGVTAPTPPGWAKVQ